MKRFFCLILFLIIQISLFAQIFSLDSCKSLALQRNFDVINSRIDVKSAQEVKKQAFSKYFPDISIFSGAYYALNPLISYGIDDIENAFLRQNLHNLYFEYGAALGLPNSISLCDKGLAISATAIQPIFAGGRIINGNRLAKIGVCAAQLQSSLTETNILSNVEENYWLIISLYDKLQTLESAVTLLDTLFFDVTNAKNAGLATRNDELKVKIKQTEIQSNIFKINNGITLAKQALCQSIGVEYSESIIFSDTIDVNNILDNLNQFDAEKSVNGRRETSLLKANVDAEQLKKKMIIGEAMPQVMVGLNASFGNPIVDNYSSNGLVFATIKIPLTDWNEVSHKIKQQELNIEKAENMQEDLTQKMKLETLQAWNNVAEAKGQLELSEFMIEQTEDNLLTMKTNYKAGLVTISDVLEAQTLYMEAQNKRTDALIDLKMKVLKYNTITLHAQ